MLERAGVAVGASHEKRKERTNDTVLDVTRRLRPVIEALARRDPDLARQMRRATCSVALNVSEGMGSRGRNRNARYHTALGSMRETRACIEVGVALGYLGSVDPEVLDGIDRIAATLFKLSK